MTDMTKDLAKVMRPLGAVQAIGVKSVETDTLGKLAADCIDFVCNHHATIQQNAEDAAKYRNDGSTHADDCYTWGPKHYECALRKLREDAKQLRALERATEEWVTPYECQDIKKRADEILREGNGDVAV
jgi:hypothetical protein